MGYIKHHAITVTSFDLKIIKEARKKALKVFDVEQVSTIITSPVNSWYTILVAPDGSKEGWDSSDVGDNDRAEFIEWIKTRAYKDGSNALRYVEYFYGDDEENSEIINHN